MSDVDEIHQMFYPKVIAFKIQISLSNVEQTTIHCFIFASKLLILTEI